MELIQLPGSKQNFRRYVNLKWIHPNAPSAEYTSSIAKKPSGCQSRSPFYRAARRPACRAPQAVIPPHTLPAVITRSRTRVSWSIWPAMK